MYQVLRGKERKRERETGEGRGWGEEGEGCEVRETADGGSARMGGVEDL